MSENDRGSFAPHVPCSCSDCADRHGDQAEDAEVAGLRAELAAAKRERDVLRGRAKDAVSIERESCAKLVDDLRWSDVEELIGRHTYQPVCDGEATLKNIAAAIRARGGS